ncbi:MAG: hypothetical protein K6G22_00775 [Lachnospiraceae bacterium]|nr:hypothetical protein [Lachnospiraceae bacterium]
MMGRKLDDDSLSKVAGGSVVGGEYRFTDYCPHCERTTEQAMLTEEGCEVWCLECGNKLDAGHFGG